MKTLRTGLLVLLTLVLALPCLADQIAPPVFQPAPGSRPTFMNITVRIECSTPGVTIFYTTDGSDPSPSSQLYSGGITVSGTRTVKARAYKFGMTESRIVSGTYTMEMLKQLAVPILPPASNFKSPFPVGATSPDSGVVIRYTTNGSDPTASSPILSGPIMISGTTTVKARAFKAGMADSPVTTVTYTKSTLLPVPAPELQPSSQTFTETAVVVATCSESGAVIRYTMNGSDPTASSTVFPSRLTISDTTTVRARAFKAGMTDSPVVQAVYLKGKLLQVPAPVLQPPSRTFTEPFTAGYNRNAESGTVIRYTVDGNDPTERSRVFSEPIPVTKTTMVKARAFKEGKLPSAVVTAVYTWVEAKPVSAPVIAPPSHTFEASELTVGASCESGAVIRYTTNGSDPTSSSPVFPGKLTIKQTTTFKVRAFKAGKPDSPVAFAIYTKGKSSQAPGPVFEPASGQLLPPYKVRISCRDSRAMIVFTKDGREPSLTSGDTLHRGAVTIEVSPPMTLKARVYAEGLDPSPIVTASYTRAALKPVPAPVLSPPSIPFTAPFQVVAVCGESGAVIRYTTNGSEPTASSPVFPGKLTISETTTLKARAFKDGMADSPVTTAVYTRGTLRAVAAPVIDPASKKFAVVFPVKVSCPESGATIRFTLNGSDPTPGSPQAFGIVPISDTATLKVRAFKDGMAPSPVVTGVYTREALKAVAAPVIGPPSRMFAEPFTAKVSCAESGADIRFTLNGSDPTATGSAKAYGEVPISNTVTLKVRAFKDGMAPSPVVTAVYTREALRALPAPVLDPPSKGFTPPFAVTARCSESGAEIRFTLDGSEPTINSPRYTGPLPLTDTRSVKVRAFKVGMAPSQVTAGTYTRLAVTPTPAKGVATAEERSRSAEECVKLLSLQREVDRMLKEMERIRKERTDRRKRLELDPDPDCRNR